MDGLNDGNQIFPNKNTEYYGGSHPVSIRRRFDVDTTSKRRRVLTGHKGYLICTEYRILWRFI